MSMFFGREQSSAIFDRRRTDVAVGGQQTLLHILKHNMEVMVASFLFFLL